MKRGDRVKLSQEWLQGNGRGAWKRGASSRGTITGFSRDGFCVKVRWAGNSSSLSYWKGYITVVDPSPTVNNYQIF